MKETREYEVTICDICEKRDAQRKCVCGKDICGDCGVEISSLGFWDVSDKARRFGDICRSHIEPEVLNRCQRTMQQYLRRRK